MINLLSPEYSDQVTKTDLTRKITIDGATKIYPVHRIPIELLFYNDQNDRIATWITEYRSSNGIDSLDDIDREEYNDIIEKFIIESNPAAIEKTTNNIKLVGQREPGVVLADGRIIDGNRRFTCIRNIAKEDPENNLFEAVILETSLENNKKQIKMLELAIQHGEEKKVDYNPIDRIVGAYQDIIETELLSINEYAESTNESVNDVKKRLALGQMIVDFLEYIKLPKQYHVARDMQVVSVFTDLQPVIKKCSRREEVESLKETVFNNIMMGAIGDTRKYVRNISSMMDNGFFNVYLREQEKIRDEINEEMPDSFSSLKELEKFVKDHDDLTEDLQISLDKSLLKAKKKETKSRPAQIVTKSISMLKDVDTRIITKLDDDEKLKLKDQLDKLSMVIDRVETVVDDGELLAKPVIEPVIEKPAVKDILLGSRPKDEPVPVCYTSRDITNLSFSVEVGLVKYMQEHADSAQYSLRFVNSEFETASNEIEAELTTEKSKYSFMLMDKMSQEKTVYLVMRSKNDEKNKAQALIPFNVNIAFGGDFEF